MELLKRHTGKKNYSSLKDRDLVKLFRRSADESAFNELMNRHQSKIYSYIYSMIQNPETANDIFQETFTKVVTKMDDTYNEQGKWIAWVMRIAHNATIDHIRKQKRYTDVNSWYSDEDSKSDYFDRLEDESIVDADDQMVDKEMKSSLMSHISKLPEEQRSVVLLRHYYEMPFKEIAELTNVSINTALGRMRYALINLRKYFEEERQLELKHAKNDDVSIRYLMREMDPSEEIEFEREMMVDENLLIEVESLRKTYQRLGKLPLREAPPDLVNKIASDAIKARREQIKRSNRWTSFMSRSVAAAAAAILIISTTIYFSNGQAYTQTDTIQQTTRTTDKIAPWVDRSNTLHFAGTSLQGNNPQPLQLEMDQSFSKLKLINSETGFAPSTRKIVLTSSSR